MDEIYPGAVMTNRIRENEPFYVDIIRYGEKKIATKFDIFDCKYYKIY